MGQEDSGQQLYNDPEETEETSHVPHFSVIIICCSVSCYRTDSNDTRAFSNVHEGNMIRYCI